ncbi:MAG: GDSL-type esterase/lipase family protein [Roseiarcus sp.]|jgi:acyl-CoA thioesterase-1
MTRIDWRFKARSHATAIAFAAICLMAALGIGSACAADAVVVALGASQTYGKGVARGEDYPAQLELMLRAKGRRVTVVNAGVNGDTTYGMLSRLDGSTPDGTRVVILQPGGNDARNGIASERAGNVDQIKKRLAARGIKLIMLENSYFGGVERGPDGQHLTGEEYHALAEHLLPQVLRALQSN